MRTVPNLESAIARAMARAAAIGDLEALTKRIREHVPGELNSARELGQRKSLLDELYTDPAEARMLFERIIQGNELQDISFLPRGELVSRAVLRIVLRRPGGAIAGYGTGFLVGDGILLTNNHVLPGKDAAALAEAEAFYERDIADRDRMPWRFALDPELFFTHEALDFTLVGVAPRDLEGSHEISELGWLPLIGEPGKASEGEWLTIIQHPGGQRKQLCVRENQLLKRDTDVLWYSTDTLAGSSGSPVFNNDWLVVALHHSGVPETKDGKWQTVDGQDYDQTRHGENDIKWRANEGIRVSRIVETLRTASGALAQPRLQGLISTHMNDLRARLPVIFRDGQPPADPVPIGFTQPPNPPEGGATFRKDDCMAEKLVTVTLAVDDEGNVRVVGQAGGSESLAYVAEKKGQVIDAPVEEERDWKDGFDTKFLDVESAHPEWQVNLPKLSSENKLLIAPLRTDKQFYGFPLPAAAVAAKGLLNYKSSAVVMNKDRKLAFYSAANIDGAQRFALSRPPDRWMWDDRIDRKHQLGNSYYTNNKFDRGHLTRREDLEWGRDPVDATRRANGTCTWTNCSPQHKIFNQDKDFPGKTAALWAGLENYILDRASKHNQFRVQSFTGPIFDANDRNYRNELVPGRFWKLVVAVDADDALFATAYILNQQFLVDRDWGQLDEAAVELPFGQFETYQVRIAELEVEIGMTFTGGDAANPVSLREVDPLAIELAKPAWKRRQRGGSGGSNESFSAEDRPLGGALLGFSDILLP
jgi:endonuclease G, mitochondrial